MPKKFRVEIPIDVSAKVLFESDRTCCVCRQKKPLQIHHIDDNPANNDHRNLAVLCLDCHRDTQIRGGFDRKLDAEQVRLYRDDWVEQVRRHRVMRTPEDSTIESDSDDVRLVAAELEIAKSQENWLQMAQVYHSIGDVELRDKYINLAIQQGADPFYFWVFARMQDRVEQLPDDIVARALEVVSDDWTMKGAILFDTGKLLEAAQTYLAGIKEALDHGEWFSAAFYMKHALNEKVVDELFKRSLRESAEEGDLWWQLRAFEELGWTDARRELLLGNERKIMESDDQNLIRALAEAKGDRDLVLKTVKEIAEHGPLANFRFDDTDYEPDDSYLLDEPDEFAADDTPDS